MVAKITFKLVDGKDPPGVECASKLDSTWEASPDQDTERTDRFIL